MVRRTTQRARDLRSNPTDAERAVWRLLRGRQLGGHKFRRQYRIHPYVVDFICLERRLIIEVDGAHHAEQAAYDAARDRFLRAERFRVLRVTDRDALTNAEGVARRMLEALGLPPP